MISQGSTFQWNLYHDFKIIFISVHIKILQNNSSNLKKKTIRYICMIMAHMKYTHFNVQIIEIKMLSIQRCILIWVNKFQLHLTSKWLHEFDFNTLILSFFWTEPVIYITFLRWKWSKVSGKFNFVLRRHVQR